MDDTFIGGFRVDITQSQHTERENVGSAVLVYLGPESHFVNLLPRSGFRSQIANERQHRIDRMLVSNPMDGKSWHRAGGLDQDVRVHLTNVGSILR
jgi:hypothetical protein